MDDNAFHDNQLIIFQALVDGTMRECEQLVERERRLLSVGAYNNVLAFRNLGQGIPVARMVRKFFPLGDSVPDATVPCVSQLYPIEELIEQDVFELASFRKREGTRFCFKGGKLERFSVDPDWGASEGLLFRIEWQSPLAKECVLTAESAAKILRKVIVRGNGGSGFGWGPLVRFNGRRLEY